MADEKYVGMEISKIHNLMRRDFCKTTQDAHLEEMTGKNGWIIGYLAERQGEDVFQKDIETSFSIRRSTVSNMLKLMEKKGYIRRESVAGDARLKKICLTRKALDTHRLLMEQIARKEALLRRNLSEEELQSFFAVLEKIHRNLEYTEPGRMPLSETKGGE